MTAAAGWAFVMYGVTAWLCWALWKQLRHGRVTWMPWSFRWPTILRADQPLRFWMTVAGEVLLLLVTGFFDLILTIATLVPNSN
jgi:hypothetical protein